MHKHTLMVPVTIKKGMSNVFEAALKKLVTATRQEKGCLFYKVYSISERKYCFFEEWENDEVMAKHNASPHLQEFFKETASIIEGEIEDVVLSEIEGE